MSGLTIDPAISNLSPEFQKAYGMALQAEKKPIEKIEERKANIQEKVKLLGDVLGKVETVRKLIPNLNSPIAIRELSVTSPDANVISGTADKSVAEPGSYTFEILQLAKGASAVSNGLEDRDSTTIGTGYVQFSLPNGDTREIFIDEENSTLDGVAKLINSAKMGVKASVVNDQSDPDAPYRMVLAADSQGVSGSIDFPEFYLIDGEADFYIDSDSPATSAKIKYEGFEFDSPGNEIKDLINGVTINLKGLTGPDKPITLTIEQDIPKTTVKVKELVEGLNSVFGFIQQQNSLDKDSDTTKTLGGEYGLRMAEERLRRAVQDSALPNESAAQVRILSDLGIQFTRNGTLTFDEKKFQHALTTNYDETVHFLIGNGVSSGFVPRLNQALGSIANSGTGVLSNQKETYTSQVDKFNREIDTREKAAKMRTENLKNKLARAQAALSKMQSQNNSMSAMLPQGGGLESLLGG